MTLPGSMAYYKTYMNFFFFYRSIAVLHQQFLLQSFTSSENRLSDFHVQENGIPQDSILSPVLFHIEINEIVKAVLKDSESSLFVDDFALCLRSRSLPHGVVWGL